MPELPEVETIVRTLKSLEGFSIVSIKLYRKKLRYMIPKNVSFIIKNSKIILVYRKAKYIIIELDNSFSIIIHLGMSGRIKFYKIENSPILEKHDHIEIFISNNIKIIMNDPRRFGIFDIIKTKKINQHKYFSSLGKDPLSQDFNFTYLNAKINTSHSPIKNLLLNQKIISGIGNIYACEILFDSRISPLKKGKNISEKKLKHLLNSIKKILKKAINNKGSSIKNYRLADGSLGNFQNKFNVYNKAGKYIKIKNKNMKIIKTIQSGQSTFYCPFLQK